MKNIVVIPMIIMMIKISIIYISQKEVKNKSKNNDKNIISKKILKTIYLKIYFFLMFIIPIHS